MNDPLFNENLFQRSLDAATDRSDYENHDNLCGCTLWPTSCTTYGNTRPWSYDSVSYARYTLEAYMELTKHNPESRLFS